LDDTPRMLSMLKGDASLLLFSCFRSIEMWWASISDE
jgi:hypothetical protein